MLVSQRNPARAEIIWNVGSCRECRHVALRKSALVCHGRTRRPGALVQPSSSPGARRRRPVLPDWALVHAAAEPIITLDLERMCESDCVLRSTFSDAKGNRKVASWCNARLVVVGRPIDVTRFRRLAHIRPSSVFRPDMLVGEAQELFSERAAPLGQDRSAKKYIFQERGEEGVAHFQNLSRSYPCLRFVLVYGWDDHSYGSHYFSNGRSRSYPVSDLLVEKVMAKHGVDDNPNGEWPYEPEMDAEKELMDLAEAHWQESLLRQ